MIFRRVGWMTPTAAITVMAGFVNLSVATAGEAKSTVDVSLQVPVVCGLTQTGVSGKLSVRLHELCNTQGATVVAYHDPSLGGRALLTYGDRSTRASTSGITEIFRIDGASNTPRGFSVDGASGVQIGSFALAIIPNQ